ncbi:DegT/DnrJ/EryC1/StrS family aminotransferase [Fuerstiella marisgermanici]|uniref:L-glutamine:2-deoxy-scyllo-inosose aminotransferase n=1 Tax=Fuerstiella marisgermanici TaxID=1891926 RepID=A0A1P8WIP4_9PLAN|nr:DegT/DnrJ/EryC1/StrS family aminotransferase [Fuerstiella marisgermanici]APZ93917.1 L-glutamine:2-deoxy-scyllo-inosose aminotransferase [Fuerstiella marisgermanici]
MSTPFTRRGFFGTAAAAGAMTGLVGESMPTAAARPADAKKANVAWPIWDKGEEESLLAVLNSGKWGRTSGGKHLLDFEAAFSERMKAKHCIATSSGTTALMTTLGALNIGPGEQVIMPPYTFVATFNVITNSFALPVFVDTDPATFQIDPKKIAAAITDDTRLLLPVHIGGSPADMEAINSVAKQHGVKVIEDACQAPLAELHGKPVGTSGLAGCISFQASKNLTSGEGGAVLTNDDAFADQCFDFHMPGGRRKGADFGRGANYRLTQFQAALLSVQLVRLEQHAKTRDENAAYLTEMFKQIPGITPASLVPGCTRSAWHLYMMRYDQTQFAGLTRSRFLKELSKAGVRCSGGYSALNNSPHVKALAENPHYQRIYGADTMAKWVEANQCPVNDKLCAEAIWFSQTQLLGSRAEMEHIVEAIDGIRKRAGDLVKIG